MSRELLLAEAGFGHYQNRHDRQKLECRVVFDAAPFFALMSEKDCAEMVLLGWDLNGFAGDVLQRCSGKTNPDLKALFEHAAAARIDQPTGGLLVRIDPVRTRAWIHRNRRSLMPIVEYAERCEEAVRRAAGQTSVRELEKIEP